MAAGAARRPAPSAWLKGNANLHALKRTALGAEASRAVGRGRSVELDRLIDLQPVEADLA